MCPNKNLDIWKNLVKELGSEGQALAAYTLNGYEIPTPEDAKLLLLAGRNKLNPEAKIASEKLKKLKLERVNAQLATLERAITSSPKDKRLETMAKLKANLEEYRTLIETDQPTVSVSKIFGGGEIENQDLYRNYAEFGTFLHYILETLQDEVVGTSKSLISAFSEKSLKELLDSYPGKFTIEGLIKDGTIVNEKELYNMSVELLGILQNYASMGYTILPELSVFTKDRWGKNVVGRLDMLAINSKGEVAIIDLKTKKLLSTSAVDSLAYYHRVNKSDETDSEFETGTRNTYENWDIQLGIYSRMLQQIGIATDEKRIVGMYYYGLYTNPEGKQFTEDAVDTFQYQFYKVKSYLSSLYGKPSDNDFLRYQSNMKKIARVFPLSNSADETMPKEKDKDEFYLNLSQDRAAELVNKIKEITDREIRSTRSSLSEAKKKDSGQEVIKHFEERLESLDEIRKAMSHETWEAADKVSFAINALDNNTRALVERLSSLQKNSSYDMVARAQELERLHKRSVGYNLVINEVRSLLIAAQVDERSKAMKLLNSITDNINRIKAEYAQLGFRNTVDMLANSLTEGQITRITEQRRQYIEDEIKYLTKKKEKLQTENKETGFWYRVSSPVLNIAKSAMKADLNPKTELESIERNIEKLYFELKGIKLDDASLQKYLEAILDPSSPAYVGLGTSYFTTFIAGSSSADWVVSSYAVKLKVALSNGIQGFVNFVEREKIQQEFDAYKVGERNVNRLNEPISEIRTVKEFDIDGNETAVQRRGFVNPISQEYYDVFDTYKNEYLKLRSQIQQADDIRRKELKTQLQKLRKDHLEWRLENTQMEYVAELYELDKLLPEEYKQERDELYEEKRLLETSAGFNNAEDLDESIVYRIAEIEVELSKLRKKYADMQEGGYARYLALQEKYYDYEINYNYFNRLYNQKKIELTDINQNIDIEALARWKQQNMIRRPKDDWYKDIGAIWDEIFMIIGKDTPAVESLKERYKEILSQYKRKGAVDSRFMTQEDIDTLAEIDELLAIYKSNPSNRGLSYQDRVELSYLFRQLEAMQMRVENPYYVQEYTMRKEELDLAWNNYQKETDTALKNGYLEQFLLKEMDFKVWYDNNHSNKYVSRLISKQAINPLPKKYNTMIVPSSEDMMEEVPDYKFRTRRIRPEAAINVNYQEDNLGYPMPKGLTIDGAEVNGTSPWLNPKYELIKSNPRVSKFYHSFVGRFLNMQKQTTGKQLGYNFPGYEQNSLNDVANKGVKEGVKNQLKMFRDKNIAIGTDYDFSINGYNTSEEDRIQFKHNTPLSIDQQTTDGIAAVIMWYEQAHVNKAMSEQQAISKSVIQYMESLYERLNDSQFPEKEERLKKMGEVIKQLRFEYKKYISGEWKTDQGLAGRFGDLLLRGVSLTRLALDVPNQLGNMLSGNVQAFLGTQKSGLYTSRNYLWAKTKIESRDGLIGSLIRDYDKIGNKSFMTKMLLYWNPLQNSLDHYYNRTRSTSDRLKQGFADGNFGMFIQDKGELEISSTIWLSIMDNIKVKVVKKRDENGKPIEYEKDEAGNIKTVNVYEAYTENSNGEIVIRPDVEWTKKDEEAAQRAVWSEIRRTQGRYADWDKAQTESGIIGRMLMFFRKYLEPALRNRFGRRESNWEAGVEAYGFYRALLKAYQIYNAKQLLGAIFGFKNTGVSEAYQQKSQMAMREMAVAAMMFILGRMLVSAIPDDDEDDKDLAKTLMYNMVAIYAKVDMETRSMVPMIIIGDIDNYMQNFTSFTNVGRDLGNVAKLLDHGFSLGMANIVDETSGMGEFFNKRAYYQRKTKLFDKGDAKIKKDLMNLTGYMNFYELFNPEDRFKNYKSRLSN